MKSTSTRKSFNKTKSSSSSLSSSSSSTKIEFFWNSQNKTKSRSRFNLLLLDSDEYYLEDFSAYLFPLSSSSLGLYSSSTSSSFSSSSSNNTNNLSTDDNLSLSLPHLQENTKIQGRLKLNSKSLLFEPLDIQYPLLKFPYKNMLLNFNHLNSSLFSSFSFFFTGFLTFLVSSYYELKVFNKISPYKVVDAKKIYEEDEINNNKNLNNINKKLFNTSSSSSSSLSSSPCFRFVICLTHTNINEFFIKIEQFRHIQSVLEKEGALHARLLLEPFIESAMSQEFDKSNLLDYHEQFLFNKPLRVNKIQPLTQSPGQLMLTKDRIYFQHCSLNNIDSEKMLSFRLSSITRLYKRRYCLRNIGLEFMQSNGSSYFFAFEDVQMRDYVYDLIMDQYSCKHLLHVPTLSDLTSQWLSGSLSNFDYLFLLNYEAGRSLQDLAQYPVFPHILTDFTSSKLDLNNPAIYRDLTKPIGALNQERLDYFLDRFYLMLEENKLMNPTTNSQPPQSSTSSFFSATSNSFFSSSSSTSAPQPPLAPSPPTPVHSSSPPPFLYGTHYSTPGYVLYYLVRAAPEYMLSLQQGKFDTSDRLFSSIKESWESCLLNTADLKELIPEFFVGNGEFLLNLNSLDLGHKSNGERVDDVVLPPWASSPRQFIRLHRQALESPYVTAHLPHWIDLIFGYQQKGEEAIKANNLFYHLTYEGAVDLDAVQNQNERSALEKQIQEFGQVPRQLFTSPHPHVRATSSENNNSVPFSTSISTSRSESLDGETLEELNLKESINSSPSVSTLSSNISQPSSSSSIAPFSPPNTISTTSPGLISSNTSSVPPNTTSVSNNPQPSRKLSFFSSLSQTATNFASILSGNSNNEISLSASQAPTSLSLVHDPKLQDNDIDDIGLVTLGEDFHIEVEQELKREEESRSNSTSSKGEKEFLEVKNNNDQTNNDIFSFSIPPHWININSIRSVYSEPITIHTKPISSLQMRLLSSHNEKELKKHSILFSSVSVDGSMKLVRVDSSLDQVEYPNYISALSKNLIIDAATSSKQSNQDLSLKMRWTNQTAKVSPKCLKISYQICRSYPFLGSNLTSCSLAWRSPLEEKDPNKESQIETNKMIYFGSTDSLIYGYSILDSACIGKCHAHTDSITSLAIEPISLKWLISGSVEGKVKIWALPNKETSGPSSHFLGGRPIAECAGLDYGVTSVAFSVHGKYAASGQGDGSVRVWDISSITSKESQSKKSNGNVMKELIHLPCSQTKQKVTCLCFSKHLKDQDCIVIATEDGKLTIIDILTSFPLSVSFFHAPVTAIASAGSYLYIGHSDGSLRVLLINTNSLHEKKSPISNDEIIEKNNEKNNFFSNRNSLLSIFTSQDQKNNNINTFSSSSSNSLVSLGNLKEVTSKYLVHNGAITSISLDSEVSYEERFENEKYRKKKNIGDEERKEEKDDEEYSIILDPMDPNIAYGPPPHDSFITSSADSTIKIWRLTWDYC